MLGYSILKHVIGYEIREKLDNCKVFLKSFLGAKMKCMEDYAQPTVRTNPDLIVINFGTNDLLSMKESAERVQHYRGLRFKTVIRHLPSFRFKPNNMN